MSAKLPDGVTNTLEIEPHQYSNEYLCRKDEGIAKGMLLGRRTVNEWEEGGYLWRIDMIEPIRVGASIRNYELFMDDKPASGGRYHAELSDAHERATYVSLGKMARQIEYLYNLVRHYKQELNYVRKYNPPTEDDTG